MHRFAVVLSVLAGCAPSVVRTPTIRVSIAVAPPPQTFAMVPEPLPRVLAYTPPEPLPPPVVVALPPPPVRTPEHVFIGQVVEPATPLSIACTPSAQVPAGQPAWLSAQGNRDDVTYTWQVLIAPHPAVYRFAPQFDAQDTNAMAGAGERVPFVSPIVGSYTIEATARDPRGAIARCETTVRVASHGLRVELSWNTNETDVDLHAITSADPRWVSDADCYYANRRPDAQRLDEAHQRWLDTDDVDGEGPENIRVDAPATDREYEFGVHFYSSHGHRDPTRAIVVVYCGDQQVGRFERSLVGGRDVSNNDFWQVAGVRWHADGTCALRPIGMLTRQRDVSQ